VPASTKPTMMLVMMSLEGWMGDAEPELDLRDLLCRRFLMSSVSFTGDCLRKMLLHANIA